MSGRSGHALRLTPSPLTNDVFLVCEEPGHAWQAEVADPRDVAQAERAHLEDVRAGMLPGIYATTEQRLGPFPRLYAMTQDGPDGKQQWWESAGWTVYGAPRPEYMIFVGPVKDQ